MKKLITTFTLLVLLVGSVFATDWKKYGTYESAKTGAYEVYFDYDATEPFELEKESVKYLIYLQKNYKKVEVHWYNMTENSWCARGAEYNYYSTLEVYKDYIIEDHVNNDGTITEYICWR